MPLEGGRLVVTSVGSCVLLVHQPRYSALAHQRGLRQPASRPSAGTPATGTPTSTGQSEGTIEGTYDSPIPSIGIPVVVPIGTAGLTGTPPETGPRISVRFGPVPIVRGVPRGIGEPVPGCDPPNVDGYDVPGAPDVGAFEKSGLRSSRPAGVTPDEVLSGIATGTPSRAARVVELAGDSNGADGRVGKSCAVAGRANTPSAIPSPPSRTRRMVRSS